MGRAGARSWSVRPARSSTSKEAVSSPGAMPPSRRSIVHDQTSSVAFVDRHPAREPSLASTVNATDAASGAFAASSTFVVFTMAFAFGRTHEALAGGEDGPVEGVDGALATDGGATAPVEGPQPAASAIPMKIANAVRIVIIASPPSASPVIAQTRDDDRCFGDARPVARPRHR